MVTESLHDKMPCPLCGNGAGEPYFEDATRRYIRCGPCELIFVPPCDWLSVEEERPIYDLHENDSNDPGYRRFLSRLTQPLLERLRPRQHGLDFGCGPGPTLSIILEEQGHQVDLYDPLYADNPSALTTMYDFICATEVVEHLRDPNEVFANLFRLLKPGGWLGIMTKRVTNHREFRTWHYIRDPTHICFYHRNTFDYLARRFNANITFIGQDVILFQR